MSMIPTQNPAALIGYYLGIFSLIPCLGLLLGPIAVVCGIVGMVQAKKNPAVSGQAHAILAMVLGAISTLLWGGAGALFLVMSAVG